MISHFPDKIERQEISRLFLQRLIAGQTIGIGVLVIMVAVGGLANHRLWAILPLGAIAVLFGVVSSLILRRGHFYTSGYVFFISTSFAISILVYIRGYQDASSLYYLWPILGAISTLEAPGGMLVLGVSTISYLVLAICQSLGFFAPAIPFDPQKEAFLTIGSFVIMFSLLAYLSWLSSQNTRKAVNQAQEAADQLRELNVTLEKHVAERTTSLEQRNTILQMLADFTRLGSQVRNENELLDQAVHLLAGRIKLDHVLVFLLDDIEEAAILRSTNSEMGKMLIADGYQLRVIRGKPSEILPETNFLHYQIGAHNYLISNPNLLKNTKTNSSYAIATGQRLLGILNIQTASSTPEATPLELMQTFADQFALSLDNIRLLDQLQRRFNEINILAGQTVRSSWERIYAGGSLRFDYDRIHVLPADGILNPEVTEQLHAGHSVAYVTTEKSPQARLVAPIILREDVIGVIGIEDNDPHHDWLAEEKALIETIASRVSLALENTRLVAEAQQRADRERVIGQITSRMRESLDIDTMLQTSIQAMRQSLNLKQAEVRLQLTTPISINEPKKRGEKDQ